MKRLSYLGASSKIAIVLLSLVPMSGSHAQELNFADLQKNIDIFSGVLAEALELEQATGLFGISLGGIDSTYLYGQGVVLEVRTPLASRRNALSLASLTSTLQNMQTRGNPFASLAQSNAQLESSPQTMALAAGAEADGYYRSMMDKIANVDYSLRMNTALQQASDYARSLRSLNNLDDSAYQDLRNEIDSLRTEMQTQFARLREIEAAVKQSADAATAAVAATDLQASLDNVLARLEPLRDQAVAKADELRERSRLAEQQYAASWQQEVNNFETNLVAAMCDYGTTLRELPSDENVSVILTGLGEDAGDNRRTDKVYVFSKSDLDQCQRGDIDKQTLQTRASHYSY